jgi:hypothetical protein
MVGMALGGWLGGGLGGFGCVGRGFGRDNLGGRLLALPRMFLRHFGNRGRRFRLGRGRRVLHTAGGLLFEGCDFGVREIVCITRFDGNATPTPRK